jgi:hypothetical protein
MGLLRSVLKKGALFLFLLSLLVSWKVDMMVRL